MSRFSFVVSASSQRVKPTVASLVVRGPTRLKNVWTSRFPWLFKSDVMTRGVWGKSSHCRVTAVENTVSDGNRSYGVQLKHGYRCHFKSDPPHVGHLACLVIHDVRHCCRTGLHRLAGASKSWLRIACVNPKRESLSKEFYWTKFLAQIPDSRRNSGLIFTWNLCFHVGTPDLQNWEVQAGIFDNVVFLPALRSFIGKVFLSIFGKRKKREARSWYDVGKLVSSFDNRQVFLFGELGRGPIWI